MTSQTRGKEKQPADQLVHTNNRWKHDRMDQQPKQNTEEPPGKKSSQGEPSAKHTGKKRPASLPGMAQGLPSLTAMAKSKENP